MKWYKVCDLNKSMFSDNTAIKAKSPLEAARKYIHQIGEVKTVTRDLFNRGSLVVIGSTASYVYNVE